MSAIEIKNIRKKYGSHWAVDDLSFSISAGEVVGFLGPNGAGKSTTMKILCGFLAPSSGEALITGIPVLSSPRAAQKKIGYLPENAPVYTDMTIHDYLNYIGKIRHLGKNERAYAITKVAEQCGITERLRQKISELSKGFRQRVGLAQALLHDPPILILDEPTTGLDPNQIVEIRNLISDIGKKKTILLSTHILGEVQATCNRVIILHRGKKKDDGPVNQVITRAQQGFSLTVHFRNNKVILPPEMVSGKLEDLVGISKVQALPCAKGEHKYLIQTAEDIRAELFQVAVDEGLIMLELSQSKTDLEEAFQLLTQSTSTKPIEEN